MIGRSQGCSFLVIYLDCISRAYSCVSKARSYDLLSDRSADNFRFTSIKVLSEARPLRPRTNARGVGQPNLGLGQAICGVGQAIWGVGTGHLEWDRPSGKVGQAIWGVGTGHLGSGTGHLGTPSRIKALAEAKPFRPSFALRTKVDLGEFS
jgi:hypothetical protein